ncbi:hypothetical protein Mapa_017077 [Marchantia paleacea]|nr:hypothetical protein Mapa_017077 [Marchantia paleacea]
MRGVLLLTRLVRDNLFWALEPVCTHCELEFVTNTMRDRHSAYINESEGVAALAAPFEINVHSTRCEDPADCLSCPLKSKFQFIIPDLPYTRKREHDDEESDDVCLEFDCEGCLIFLDQEVDNGLERFKFATSGLLDKMKGFHQEQMLKAKQESAALKKLLQTQKSAHETEVSRLQAELAALRFENTNLTFNLEETQRRLRFLKTMDLNLKSKFSKSENSTAADTGVGIVQGACTMAMERARRYLAVRASHLSRLVFRQPEIFKS